MKDWYEIARANVEAHADWTEDSSPDDIYEAAYLLAFDKLKDEGCPQELLGEIATRIAMSFAFP